MMGSLGFVHRNCAAPVSDPNQDRYCIDCQAQPDRPNHSKSIGARFPNPNSVVYWTTAPKMNALNASRLKASGNGSSPGSNKRQQTPP